MSGKIEEEEEEKKEERKERMHALRAVRTARGGGLSASAACDMASDEVLSEGLIEQQSKGSATTAKQPIGHAHNMGRTRWR